MKLYITVGCSGSGKSTWSEEMIHGIKEFKGDVTYLESDGIRFELFKTLDKQFKDDHNQVFNLMNKRLNDALQRGDDIVYDATNLSRKRRIPIYELAKKHNYHVYIVMFLKPYQYLVDAQNNREKYKQVEASVIKKQYRSFEPPRMGVDCDECYIIDSINMTEYYKEFYSGLTEPHNSPYHKESIVEHIMMTVDTIKNSNYQDKDKLNIIASFHDLGKPMSREEADETNRPDVKWFKDKFGAYDRFIGHENISAMYYLNATLGHDKCFDPEVLECIWLHMIAHKGISDKLIKKYKLSENELKLLNQFAEVDSKSKIQDDSVLDYCKTLREEYKLKNKRL